MNFDDFNLIYKYNKENVYPNVQCLWNKISSPESSPDSYLNAIGENPHEYKLLAFPYVIKPDEFLKKYKNNCIIFSSPADPQLGLMTFIHQMNPTLHIFSRLYCFIDKNKVHGYISGSCLYKDYKEALNLIDEISTISKTGSTDESSRPGF